MSLLNKANDVNAAADKAKGQIDALKAQVASLTAENNDLKAQLAEVPAVADVLDQVLAKLA